MSEKKTVLLAITGGIAAYKTPDLVRSLRKAGFDVIPILTSHATEFVSSLSLGTVSGYEPVTTITKDKVQTFSMSKTTRSEIVSKQAKNAPGPGNYEQSPRKGGPSFTMGEKRNERNRNFFEIP